MEGNLTRLLGSLGLDGIHEQVLDVYLVGSRLWGTNSYSSDYDFLIIVTDNISTQIPKSQHKNQYDFTLLTRSEFIARLTAGSIVETICCLMRKDESCVLRREIPTQHLIADVSVVDEWVNARHEIDREKAKKFWQKGKQKDAFKILQHMLRAESVVQGFKAKLRETPGHLNSIFLALPELQAFVSEGSDEGDWAWLGLEWDAVQASHRARLQKVKEVVELQ